MSLARSLAGHPEAVDSCVLGANLATARRAVVVGSSDVIMQPRTLRVLKYLLFLFETTISCSRSHTKLNCSSFPTRLLPMMMIMMTSVYVIHFGI